MLRSLQSIIIILCSCLFAVQTFAATEQDRRLISDAVQKGDFDSANKIFSQLKTEIVPIPFPQPIPPIPTEGSVFYEELNTCGFYPQETRLECTITVKQQFGYGGPVGAFGTREHVTFCVDSDNNGIFTDNEIVGHGNVHIHDEAGNVNGPWHYAVYRDFDPMGGLRTTLGGASTTTATVGTTRRARAILSWFLPVSTCNNSPVWGNSVNFRVRYDPIR